MKILSLLLFYVIGFVNVFGACYMIRRVFRWKIKNYVLLSAVCGLVTFLYRLLPSLIGYEFVPLNENIAAVLYIVLIWLLLTDRSFKSLVVSICGYMFIFSVAIVMSQPVNIISSLVVRNSSSVFLAYLITLCGNLMAFGFAVFIGKIGKSSITEPMSIWNIIFIALTSFVMRYITLVTFKDEISYDTTSFSEIMLSLISLAFLSAAVVMTVKLTESRYYSKLNSINESYLNAQKDYYEIKQSSDTEIRRIRHDMKNHLICIRELAAQGKYDELESYVSEISDAVKDADRLIHTGNGIVDAIVNEKAAAARKLGIQFEWEGTVSGLDISAVDSCTLVSNLLDNALEACDDVDVAKRFISLSFRRSEHFLFMICENSAARVVEMTDGRPLSTKSDKLNHGFGLNNIIRCVEKYGGELKLSSELKDGEPIFTAQAIIPI